MLVVRVRNRIFTKHLEPHCGNGLHRSTTYCNHTTTVRALAHVCCNCPNPPSFPSFCLWGPKWTSSQPLWAIRAIDSQQLRLNHLPVPLVQNSLLRNWVCTSTQGKRLIIILSEKIGGDRLTLWKLRPLSFPALSKSSDYANAAVDANMGHCY